ncbi:MAG: protein kinase, partial [Verrucomicrobiota bacterium]
ETFSKQYCVCVREDGSPREISRAGSAVTYKAIDYRSGRPVALQVIPTNGLEDATAVHFQEQARDLQMLEHPNIAHIFEVGREGDHILFASEFLLGETADKWLVAHGPMPPDAVVRVGLQVLSALAEATFQGLSHRAIQPSNIMVVPGASPDGGWPFVKLLNFGLAGLKLYSVDKTGAELVPAIAPQFASPEQLADGTVDFRSEIFSLGATMCFLLTGAVPLAGRLNAAGMPERTLPRGSQIPRTLRKILAHMLEVDREKRPHDPVLLAGEMRQSLAKLEKRNGSGQRVSALVRLPAPIRTERRVFSSPFKALAIAASVLLLAALAAGFFPHQLGNLVHRQRPIAALGVPIGVPETRSAAKVAPIGFSREDNSGLPAPSAAEVASLSQPPATTLDSRPRADTSPAGDGTRDLAIAKSTAFGQHPVQPSPPPAVPERKVRSAPAQSSSEPSERATAIAAEPRSSELSVTNRGANDPVETTAAASTQPPVTAPEETSGATDSPYASTPPDVVPENSPALITRDESSPAPRFTQPPSASVVAAPEKAFSPATVGPAPPAEAPAPETSAPVVAQQTPPPSPARNFGDQGVWGRAWKNNGGAAAANEQNPPPAAMPPVEAPARVSVAPKTASAKSKVKTSRIVSKKNHRSLPPLRVGQTRAEFVGTNAEGNWVLRLPSGETVVTPPAPDPARAPVEKHGRVRRLENPPFADHSQDPTVVAQPADDPNE